MAQTRKLDVQPLDAPTGLEPARIPSIALPDPFALHLGGTLHGARIAYESWGALNRARSNALLLFTGLSP